MKGNGRRRAAGLLLALCAVLAGCARREAPAPSACARNCRTSSRRSFSSGPFSMQIRMLRFWKKPRVNSLFFQKIFFFQKCKKLVTV